MVLEDHIFQGRLFPCQNILSVLIIILSKQLNMWLSKAKDIKATDRIPQLRHSLFVSLWIEMIFAIAQEPNGDQWLGERSHCKQCQRIHSFVMGPKL